MYETQTRMGNDGFFGQVLSDIAAGVGTIGREILPVWTAKQLGLQKSNQLYNPTYDPTWAAPRVDDPAQRATVDQPGPDLLRQVWELKILDMGGFHITGGGLVVAGVAFGAILLILKRF